MNPSDQPDTRRGRLQLILLALVFFGPLAVAITMYYTGGTPEGDSVNYGTLLEPPLSLDARTHFDTGLRGRWTLLVKSSGDCGEVCSRALIDIRQVRLATGREIDRIERALLLPAGTSVSAETLEAHPGLVVLQSGDAAGDAVAGAFEAQPADHIYIVDPIGNLILRYPLEPERKALLGDLKKLLKLSRIG